MIYHTVRVDPNKDAWRVNFDKSNTLERADVKTKPNALGFYHYPQTMSDQEALNELVTCMIQKHESDISDLTRSIEALKTLLK